MNNEASSPSDQLFIDRPADAVRAVRQMTRNCPTPLTVVIALDERHALLGVEEIPAKKWDEPIPTREIVKHALIHDASSVVIARNKCGTRLQAAQWDVEQHARLRETLTDVNVRLLDHLLVVVGGWLSLANSSNVATGK